MSGYLQRLAAQAFGHASGVRPPARLPLRAPSYSPGELVPADASVAQVNADSAADSPESAPHASNIPTASNVPSGNRPGRSQPNDGVEAMPRAPVVTEPPAALHRDSPARYSRQDRAHPPHQEHQAGAEPRAGAQSYQDVPADVRSAPHPHTAHLAAGSPSNGVRSRREEEVAIGHSLPAGAQGRARLWQTDTPVPVAMRSAGDSFFAPQLKPRPTGPRIMTEHAPETPRRVTARRTGEGLAARRAEPSISGQRDTAGHAPDVHIHIGRVELSAIMAPAAARREPPANGKNPMSLEQYLRRRDGRTS